MYLQKKKIPVVFVREQTLPHAQPSAVLSQCTLSLVDILYDDYYAINFCY